MNEFKKLSKINLHNWIICDSFAEVL
jgi:hypothetical protein